MRILVTTTTVLLFKLLTVTAHAVPASELPIQNTTSDVYEIQESGMPKTTFTAPKPKKPTLREIVYYHVIERPYGGSEHLERHSDPEPPQIEMDETMRPFTNGHGYQFADIDLHETEKHDDTPPHSDDAEDANEEEDHSSTLPEEVTEEVPTDTTIENSKPDEGTEKPIVTTPSEEKKNRIKQRQFLFDRLKERYSANFKKPSATEKINDSTTVTEKDDVTTVTEKEDVTTVTEKVETTTITSTSTAAPTSTSAPISTTVSAPAPAVRSKRTVNYEEIPLAPTLPPLDYSSYPGLRVYSGIQPMYQTTVTPVDIDPSNEDDLKKAMKFKINDIFVTMRPYDDDYRNNDDENKNDDKINDNNGDNKENNNDKINEDNDDNKDKDNDNKNDIRVEKNNDGNDIRVVTYKPENQPKTYGMNLSEDQGTVWNNMWRPIDYHVGGPIKLYEVNEYEVSTIEPVEQDTTTKDPTTTTTTTKKPNLDTDDIFVDVKKHRHTTTTAKPETKPSKGNEPTESKREKEDPSDEKEKDNSSNEEKKDDNIAAKSLQKHKKKPTTTEDKPNNEPKPDMYEQLMNSDKFWKWLAQWTSNYMEVLSERVKDMVKKEVAKEMKKYENAHQNVPLNQTRDENKPNNATTPIKDDKGANKTVISPKEEPVINNNTLIVDGKEIPITNTTNFNQGNDTANNNFLRKQRDENKRPNNKLPTKDKVDDKKENDNKNKTLSNKAKPNSTKHEENYNNVKADTIYGSSTGNDKVTNIFIFYPGTEAEKIVDGLKPYLNNSVTGIATAIKDDKKNDKEDEKLTEKPIEKTSLANKEPENVITQKPTQSNDKTEYDKKNDEKDEKVTEKPIEKTNVTNKEPVNETTQKPTQSNDKTEETRAVADKNSTKLKAKKEPNSNRTETKASNSENKEPVTKKNTGTEKVTEKGTSSATEIPKGTGTSTDKTVVSSKAVSPSTLAPLNSTSIAPTKANSSSLTP